MSDRPAVPQLAHIQDDELERLATAWRGRALKGDKEANGIAHLLEVERRRRLRASQMAELPPEPEPAPRVWWKLWQRFVLPPEEARWPK